MSDTFDCEIYCPHCAQRVDLQIGLGQRRLLLAIALQAERFGTEIDCRHCGDGFVYTRVRRERPQQLGRPHFDLVPKDIDLVPKDIRSARTMAPAPKNTA